jgi:hypothetical protein
MGQVITGNASAARIMDVSFRTQTRATAHGGEVQTLVESRLGVLNAALTTVDQQLTEASAKDDAQHAVLMARDSERALEIGAVIDEIWNALGRLGKADRAEGNRTRTSS